MKKIYITIKQTNRSVLVELRNDEDQDSEYIGARKQWDIAGNELKPASVTFHSASPWIGWTPEEASDIAHLLTRAALACELLDIYIKDIEDFKKVVEFKVTSGGYSLIMETYHPAVTAAGVNPTPTALPSNDTPDQHRKDDDRHAEQRGLLK